MTDQDRATDQIATYSIEEGLDFGCNLLMSSIRDITETQSQMAQQLIRELTLYISVRYAGEFLLALEYLAGLAHLCGSRSIKNKQFWSQLQWIACKMQISEEEKGKLNIPNV